MLVQKRSHEALEEEDAGMINLEKPEDEVASDRSHSSSNGDKERYVLIKLSDVRNEVQCPICLGVIRKTRTIMECLHRFCKECIEKSMRLGNNECPACRTHCASQCSLRDDPNYDALIASIYPNIDKYEEEIQASIAHTLHRQTEALSRKQNAKATTIAFMRRSQGSYQTSLLRRRRNFRNAGDLQVSNDNENMNDKDEGKDSSSGDEQTETKTRRCNRGGERGNATTDADGTGDENIPEMMREIMSASGILAWGKKGHRSHNRVKGKNSKNSRISRLVDHLGSSGIDDDEYVSLKARLQADEVELCLVIKPQASLVSGESTVDPNKDHLHVVGDQETLAELRTYDNTTHGYLVMAYKRKLLNSDIVGLS